MNDSHDQGSFLTGLTMGMVAGAAGYFLFGTKDGKKIRHKLGKEWDTAKLHLLTQGTIDNPQLTLRDVVKEFIDAMAPDSEKTARTAANKAKNPAKKSSKKFKNT